MNDLLACFPILLSGIIGIICDVKFDVENPCFYWLLGSTGTFITLLIIIY